MRSGNALPWTRATCRESPVSEYAEFRAVSGLLRDLTRRLPGDELAEDRAYLLAVSAYVEGLAARAPRPVAGERRRLIGEGTRAWLVGSAARMPRNRGPA